MVEAILDVPNVEVILTSRPRPADKPWVSATASGVKTAVAPTSSTLIDAAYSFNASGTTPYRKRCALVMLVNGQPLKLFAPKLLVPELDHIDDEIANWLHNLDRTKDKLGLTITQVAELFGVTRKSVYDWYEGAAPRADKVEKMNVLLDVINGAAAPIDLKRLKLVWNVEINGESFCTLLNDDSLGDVELRNALTRKLNELSSRLVQAARLAPRISKGGPSIPASQLSEFDNRSI